jgi:hypothetical protein
VSHRRTRASALALIALTGAFVAVGSSTAGADPAANPAVTVISGQSPQTVETGAAAVVLVDVVATDGTGLELTNTGTQGAVRVCAVGSNLALTDVNTAAASANCIGWIVAGDRNHARVAVIINPTSGSGAITYSIVAADADGQTVVSTGLPNVSVGSVGAGSESAAILFQQQIGSADGVYWIASNKAAATVEDLIEANVNGGGFALVAAVDTNQFLGGVVIQQQGASGQSVVLRVQGGLASSTATYINKTGGVPAAPTLTGVPTGVRFTSAATIGITEAVPTGGAKWFRVGPSGAWTQGTTLTIAAGQPDGTYTASGQLVDGALRPGGVTTSASWTVNDDAPAVTGAPTGNVTVGTAVNLTASKSGAASYRISTDGGTTFGTAQASGTFAVANPAAGARTIQIKAVDSAGGESLAAAVTYTVVAASGGSAPDYLIVDWDGNITPFPAGSTAPVRQTAPHSLDNIVLDIVYTPDRLGAYTLDDTGFIVAYGTATLKTPNATNVPSTSWSTDEFAIGMSVTPSGNGYWVFTSRGRSLAYGDATDFQDIVERGITLNQPMIDAAAAVGSNGVYLVAEDGGVFAFGDATFRGSLPGLNITPNESVVGILPQAGGYFLVAADGGVFAFGTTQFQGSIPGITPAITLNESITAMVNQGTGYLLVAADGGVFAFGTPFSGSLGATGSQNPVTGIAAR